MDPLQFIVPVRIVTGADQPVTEIYDAAQAVVLLDGWASGREGPLYKAALEACRSVAVGAMPAEEARRAFSHFARVANILAKDSLDKVAIGLDGEVRPSYPRPHD